MSTPGKTDAGFIIRPAAQTDGGVASVLSARRTFGPADPAPSRWIGVAAGAGAGEGEKGPEGAERGRTEARGVRKGDGRRPDGGHSSMGPRVKIV